MKTDLFDEAVGAGLYPFLRERADEVERRAVSGWTLTLLGGAGAIWTAIVSAMVYAVRAAEVRARGLEPPRSLSSNGT